MKWFSNWFAVLVLTLSCLPAAAQERRLALLIGNEAYGTPGLSKLSNPHEDVDRVAGGLRAAGFRSEDIVVLKDRNRAQTIQAIADFSDRLRAAGADAIGFFYYSGHGGSAEANGRRDNYIVPVGEPIEYADDLESFGVSLPVQVGKLQASGAGSIFVVVDACRNTLSWRNTMSGAVTKGVVRQDFNPTGMMMLFAAGDGAFADDDGVFSGVLSEEIPRQGQDALKAFSNVSQRVGEKKGFGLKMPTIIPALTREVCFVSCRNVIAPPPTDEATALAQAISANTLEAYTAFSDRFPKSQHLTFISAKIVELTPRPQGRRAGEAFRDPFVSGGGQGPVMVVLPKGRFTMGSPASETARQDDEGPQRTVEIGYTLAVGKYEVTWDEYAACVAEGACPAPADDGFGKGNRPVTNVSWDDAKKYAAWLRQKTGQAYRLLSEAEWEYAARAGSSGPYPWGSSASRSHANYGADQCCSGLAMGDDRWEKTAPAGSFAANAFGLHDMHGNVWEWAEDCYAGGYSVQASDGSAYAGGDCARRVVRGGAWSNAPRVLRSAIRFGIMPGSRDDNRGFRLARTLPD